MEDLKYSEKEIAIFQGLIQLMREGANPYSIKVSDIAIAANVGKGTIYDYFNSKEEAISKAIMYNINNELKEVFIRINNKNDFKTKFYEVLQIIADNLKNNLSTFNMLLSAGGIQELYKYLMNDQYDISKFTHIIGDEILHLLDLGFKENIITTKESKYYQVMAMQGAVCSFSNYISRQEIYPNVEIKEAMDTAYKLLIKALN